MKYPKPIRTLAMLAAFALLLPLVGCAAELREPVDNPEDRLPSIKEDDSGPSENGTTEGDLQSLDDAATEGDLNSTVRTLAFPMLPQPTRWIELALPEGAGAFWQAAMSEFLSGAGNENRVFSPVSVYLALAMLTQAADGNSRAQLLSLLGADSLETLQHSSHEMWRACFFSGEDVNAKCSSSLWTRDDFPYRQETLTALADVYYAEVFSGPMGSAEYNEALQNWIDSATGRLLTDQVGGLGMNANTVLSLVTALYLKAPWQKQFLPENTVSDVFHAQTGELTCDYLRETETRTYYVGENFTAVGKEMAEIGTMYFLLPNEGVTPEELLQDEQALRFLSGDLSALEGSRCKVNLKLPKFDVSGQLSLIDSLKALGVTDVFDESVADFSPLTDAARDLYVSQVEHGARVKIDEEGCEAAAYTMISIETKMARPVSQEIDFTLDRPFLFGVVTVDDLPLFTGVVHQP